ncbi:MAG: CRISPR-associated protein Cas4, partial [Deltaproteobacteria bacterium HGW-Deltaproteobacteria-22]
MVDSPLRVMGLHSITYCPRLFYLEEVEGLQVEDEAVFSGRALHEILEKEEKDAGEIVSMEVGSERLGLTGKVDALRRRNGEIIPYEHKKGRSRKDGKKAQAWPADRIQVCAYGMLLEEALAKPVRECRVRYHADAVTVTLPLDEQARCDVMETLKRAQQLRECIQRPSISKNECQCIKCSLSLVCLPEEERFIEDPDWQPVRLFPPECDRRTLHILEHEARVSKCGDGLSVETPSTGKVEYPVHEIGAVCLHGYGQVTTQALHLCAANEVFVHYFTPGGRYVSTLAPVGIQVQRRIRQYHALADPAFCLELCRRLVMAKVENGLRYMLRATR